MKGITQESGGGDMLITTSCITHHFSNYLSFRGEFQRLVKLEKFKGCVFVLLTLNNECSLVLMFETDKRSSQLFLGTRKEVPLWISW